MRTHSLASVRNGLVDAFARALALFSILLNFTLPFGVALAGPVDETGTALCLSGYGARADTNPFAEGSGAARDDSCLLCITCHAPSMGGSGVPALHHHDPVAVDVVTVPITIDILAPRGGEGAMRVRAPPATL